MWLFLAKRRREAMLQPKMGREKQTQKFIPNEAATAVQVSLWDC